MGFLHDPVLDLIIGIIVTIVVAFVVYLKQRSRKEIAYDVIANTPVLSIDKEVKGKLQVLYEGKPIDDARLVVLRIWNSGKSPISSIDYERPLTFDFGENSEVLDATIIETKPPDLKEDAAIEKSLNKAIVKPLLLNSNNSIKLKVLLTNFGGNIKASARISGINQILPPEEFPIRKRIRNAEEELKFSSKIAVLSLASLVIYSILVFAVFNIQVNNDSKSNLLFSYHLPIIWNIILSTIFYITFFGLSISILMIFYYSITLQISKYIERRKYKV